MPNIVDDATVRFLGDTTDLDRKTAKARSDIQDLAKKPAVVTAPDQGPTISYWSNNTERAKRSYADIAREKAQNDALDAAAEKAATERLKAAQRLRVAEEYAANEQLLRARSVAKHEQYLADKAAEESITDTLDRETAKRINRIRGLGAVFRSLGLQQYGIDETTINAAISIYNKASGAENGASAAKASAAASAAKAAADTESAAATSAAATAEAAKAEAATAAAAAETEGATAAAATAVAAEATAVSMTTALAVFLPLAAAGAVFAIAMNDARRASEARLKIEEAAAKGMAAQLSLEKQMTDELKKQRAEDQAGREVDRFKADLAGMQLSSLQQRRKELEEITNLPLQGSYNEKTTRFDLYTPEQLVTRKKQIEELRALDAEIDKRQHSTDQSFSNIAEAHAKYVEDTRKAFDQEIAETRKKAQELAKEQAAAFTGLFDRAYADNPYVRQMIQNEQATERFRETARGLPADLQSVGYALVQRANDLATFKIQLDSTFQALDLRDTAAKFGDPTKAERLLDYNRSIAEQARTSNSTNPDVARQGIFEAYRQGLFSKDQAFQQLSRFERTPDGFRQLQSELQQTFTYEQQKQQERLDERLNLARGVRTPDQQAEVEARVATYARGLDPDALRKDQREQLKDLFERQAGRVEKRAEDSLKAQQEMARYLKEINENGVKIQGAAASIGKQALEINIVDKDKRVSSVSTPTPEDTAVTYSLGFVGGTNL